MSLYHNFWQGKCSYLSLAHCKCFWIIFVSFLFIFSSHSSHQDTGVFRRSPALGTHILLNFPCGYNLNKSHLTNNHRITECYSPITRAHLMRFHSWQDLKPLHSSSYCTDCFTQGLKQGRVNKGSPWSCFLPGAHEQGPDTNPFPPEQNDGYTSGRINSTSLLLMGLASHLPLHSPYFWKCPCQPDETSAAAPAPGIPPLSFALALCLTASLSKGHCNQSLTPLIHKTLGPFKKLYRWIFVATWSSSGKGFRNSGG